MPTAARSGAWRRSRVAEPDSAFLTGAGATSTGNGHTGPRRCYTVAEPILASTNHDPKARNGVSDRSHETLRPARPATEELRGLGSGRLLDLYLNARSGDLVNSPQIRSVRERSTRDDDRSPGLSAVKQRGLKHRGVALFRQEWRSQPARRWRCRLCGPGS